MPMLNRSCRNVLHFAAVFVALGLTSAEARGQDAPANAEDAAWRRRMEERMAALEQENAELKKEVGRVAAIRGDVMQDAATRSGQSILGVRPFRTTPPQFDTRKYVAEGDFPGSIIIPGTNVSIQVGGFVQLDAISDTNNIGSRDSFIVSSIPTVTDSAGQTNFSVRQTRLFIKTETPTKVGPLITFVEGDFFGPDGTDFRLRHAYGQFGDRRQVLAGQTWTTFMDASVYPAIFDYQGPNGMVLVRHPMVRYTHKASKELQWQVAVEDPEPDISEAASQVGDETSQLPDLAANIRWTPEWGHLQLAGIARMLTFDPEVGSRDSEFGWGVNLSGSVNLFEPVAKGKQDNVVFQVAAGQGIANYFNDTSGLGMDAWVRDDDDMEALGIWGGFVAYQHYWGPKWASAFGYSYLEVEDGSGQPDDTYKSGHYFVANIMYYPVDRIWLGVEALYGIREDQDGDSGDDGRLSFSIQFRF